MTSGVVQVVAFLREKYKRDLTSGFNIRGSNLGLPDLGNPEHPRRTRGTPGSLSWKDGFPDAGGYKRRERKKKKELTQLHALHARVQALEERDEARSTRPAEATPEATPPSQ